MTYVALPDTSFDPSSQLEARLVRSGLDYLRPTYRDAHWIVYKVEGAPPLLDGPGRLVSADGRRIEFDASQAGHFTLKVRSSTVWQVDAGNACTGTNADGWLTVDTASAERIVLTQQEPLLAFFDNRAGQSCESATGVTVKQSRVSRCVETRAVARDCRSLTRVQPHAARPIRTVERSNERQGELDAPPVPERCRPDFVPPRTRRRLRRIVVAPEFGRDESIT